MSDGAGSGVASRGPGPALYAVFAITTLAITVVGLLLVLEIGLRIIDWPSPGLYQDGVGPLPLSLADGRGSAWRAYPGDARIRHWDYDVDVHLNRHGFIDHDPAPRAPGERRIGLFGDSFAAGMGVTPDERFATRWWRDLQRADERVSVYNFGSAWSGTGQSAAFLAANGAHYELDELVLAVFGGNELGDNQRWESSRAQTPEERAAMEQRMRSRGWRDEIRNRSRAAGYLYVALARGLARREVRVSTREDLPDLWPDTERGLDAFLEAAKGRPLTVWYLPATIEWSDDAWEQVSSGHDWTDADRHVVRDAIRLWAESRGVPFLDVTPALAGRSVAELRFANDGHWNAAGHALVAEYLSQHATIPGESGRAGAAPASTD